MYRSNDIFFLKIIDSAYKSTLYDLGIHTRLSRYALDIVFFSQKNNDPFSMHICTFECVYSLRLTADVPVQ